MKKNNYKKTRKPNFRPVVILVILAVALVMAFRASRNFLMHSGIFRIKKISYPKSASLPSSSGVFDLLGENLFSVDTDAVSKKIQRSFPQLSNVRISRRLPDELVIEARRRNPIAMVKLSDKYFYTDSDAVIILANANVEAFPVILGVASRPSSIVSGQIYDDKNLKFGLEIITEFGKIPYLKNLKITKVNVSNLSRASFVLGNSAEVIIGEERLADRLQLLAVLVARLRNEFAQIKYIDLRFKEPVIAKK